MIRQPRQWTPLLALTAALALAAPVRPAGDGDGTGVLKLLPADTAFYGAVLRNREQLDVVLKSKAWAKLINLPVAKLARETVEAQLAMPDGELAPYLGMLRQPEVRELLDLLGEALSDEIFVYGGSGWVDAVDLLMRLSNAATTEPTVVKLTDENNETDLAEPQVRTALHTLAANLDLIRVPDLVVGFKVKDAAKAEARVKRLEELLGLVLADAPPPVRAGFRRVKVGDSSVLNFTLDGSLIPWEDMNVRGYEDEGGEFDPLLKKLKGLTLSVSVGVHHGYLVVAVGQSAGQLGAIGGKGPRLSELPEFKPLVQLGGQRFTSIGYTSKALRVKTSPAATDYADIADWFDEALKVADLPEKVADNLRKDAKSIVAALSKNRPETGASLSFSFLTGRGSESYSYEYGTFPGGLDGSKPLTLMQHLGGRPIYWYVSRSKTDVAGYLEFARAVPRVYGHVEEAVFTKLDDGLKEQYLGIKKPLVPLVKRLDEITGTLLLPATADGQFGFVLDAKWKSKQWHTEAPATEEAMPLPELGLLLGISDEAKFRRAMKEYHALINDTLSVVSQLSQGQVPELKMPEPTVEKGAGGTLAYYPIPPELGLDEQVVPTAGLSKSVVAMSLSRAHTERLLKPTPLATAGGPPADLKTRPLASASGFDWPAFVDALTPWIELALESADLPEEPGPAGDVRQQVRTVLRVLKVYRGSWSVTYYESGARVRHSQSVWRDLE